MKENFIESSLNDKEITTKYVEEKILDKFQYLNNKNQLHNLFSSYDFRHEEENKVKFWNELLKFLFLNIFSTFGMKISEIKTYTNICNYIPVSLINIIHELRIRKKLITDSDIANDKFYISNFPELYSNNDSSSEGWGSYLMSGVKKLVFFGGIKLGCAEKKEEEEEEVHERRTDILDDDKYITLSDNTIVFNYELFQKNAEELLSFLTEILGDNDSEVIPKNDFIKEVNSAYLNNGGIYKGKNLIFGTIYIDYCLKYLEKIKMISFFIVENNNKKIEFIKLLLNKNDKPKEKDIVFAQIILKCNSLQLKINELENKINLCINNSKKCINKGDKKTAKSWLMKKKFYEQYKKSFENTYTVLNNQMMEIKNAESNVKTTEILKSCNNLFQGIGADRDEFIEISEDLKEQKNLQNEISSGLKEFADDDEELDEELNKLENENKKEEQNLEFPSALNQPINPFSFDSQQLYNQK